MNTAHPDSHESVTGKWLRRLLIVLLFLPLLILVFTPLGRRWSVAPIIFLLVAVLNFILLVWLFRRTASGARAQLPKPRIILPDEHPTVITELMDVCIATQEDGIRLFRGLLRAPADESFARLKAACGNDTISLLQPDEKMGTSIILMDRPLELARVEKPARPVLHWGLFFLTLLTTTWAGAAYQGISLLQNPEKYGVGIPYALGLLAILGCHELGHYFAARYHNMNVTPPFFIPVPFALGTFGAFIRLRSAPEERTSLFDMAIAGPLAGLLIAVPALLLGLRSSHGVPRAFAEERLLLSGFADSSLLFGLVSRLQLSPLAFAGWLGFLITVLNMLPVGQLDGGHIMRAMFGTRSGKTVSRVVLGFVFLLAVFVVPSLLLWVVIIFFIAGNVTPPLNDLTPVSVGRRVLGLCTFALLTGFLVPLPESFWTKLFSFYPGL